jgi:ankyrin repeat protein
MNTPEAHDRIRHAIGNNQQETVREMLLTGYNVNYSCEDERTNSQCYAPILYLVASQHMVELVMLCIELGANVNAQFDGNTALLANMEHNNFKAYNNPQHRHHVRVVTLEMVMEVHTILLEAGADVHNAGTSYGFTLLETATRYPYHPEFFVDSLIKAGIDVDEVDEDGFTEEERAYQTIFFPEPYYPELSIEFIETRMLLLNMLKAERQRVEKSRIAVGMAMHGRLGDQSILQHFSPEVINMFLHRPPHTDPQQIKNRLVRHARLAESHPGS